ncbi:MULTISPECIES: SNF2-related protein [Roseomonadaceae]|uniref:DEAD/DEAH box helicase family protein n=1 Tax=Falsiroseomonas oleicola TaxID=2801474 RepID=A0ABS6HAS0_9PROT|nr:SNF2-related protein [Roseomonas oleicola]MBU8544420.1 DEAD/DEAH box helicase family protein [Roseomonas oleicola]
MSRNPYVDLCLHLQALRRQAEETRTPLAPALGVAGSIYTHQVANVLRVLTDVRVRHLLADEVGLGKTVQALMILNALRRQRRDLRALVVVPDRLVPQWRDELMNRSHAAPYETIEAEDGQYVRLAWEDQLRQRDDAVPPKLTLTDIDPTRYQVLIVDELHRLRGDLQDRIVRVSGEFEHLLVLTATPSFQRPERHAQLFALLEPERAARARWEVADDAGELAVNDDISKWPGWATQRIVDALLERDRAAASAAEQNTLKEAAMALCAYRRVIRTRRVDYSGVLPRRQHHPIVVEPLGAEVDRQTLLWRYFTHLDSLSARFEPVLLAKRAILSSPSIEQRVDFFRRRGHERDGLLERVKPLLHKSAGDSRADALVDLLAMIWSDAPGERVLVAAQDNLTVDYLFGLVQARLPEIGPIGARVRLVAARVRQGMETVAVEDLGGFGNETNENLEAFQRGDAQVLFAPEAAQVGLNLQCARVLVLYSVPWRPEEVEQWIGRLDRIGNVAAFSSEGAARTIDVYTIAQRGLVDEKVVTVLGRFSAFERSVNLDGAHLAEVAQAIEDAALRPENASWRSLEERTALMAAEDASQELTSALRPHLPWHVGWAAALRERLDAMQPVPPVIGGAPGYSSVGPKAWDRAIEPMLWLLDKAGDYHVRSNIDPDTGTKFRTLWYRFGDFAVSGRREASAKVVFTFGADPSHERSPRHAHAFITRRADIGTPPLRFVTMTLDGLAIRRKLRFANFGDQLHDELIDNWANQQVVHQALDVTYFDDHELWQHTEPGWFLLRMSTVDPAEALAHQFTLEATERAVAAVVTRSPNEKLVQLMAPFARAAECALEADARWLRAALTARTNLCVRRKTPAGWQDVPQQCIAALMNPMAHEREGLPRAATLPEPDAAIKAELRQVRAGEQCGGVVWSAERSSFVDELRARLCVVAEEAGDAWELAHRELMRAEATLADTRERGNRAQITRAENLRDAAADAAAMTKVYWAQREAWLRACEPAIVGLRPRERLVAAIRARKPSN